MSKISKVIYGGQVLIDLTADTVKADKLLSPYTAHGADGEPITGTCTYDVDSSGTTASAANQGSPFLPDTSRIETYAVIGAEHKKNIAHLIVTKAKRSIEVGTPLSSPTQKDEIEYLEKVLKA